MRVLKSPTELEAIAEVEGFAPRAVLDPHDPIKTAREMVVALFTDRRGQVLYRHRGAFWQFRSGCYLLADDEAIRTAIWTFLEKAKRLDQKGNPTPFKPSRARVSDTLDALGAVCELGAHREPPVWLANSSNMPPPGEFLPVANGLVHLPSGELHPSTPQYFGLSASGVAFELHAPEPRHWLAFLGDLFGADRQAIEALQDWFGYVLASDTSQQKILLVVGPKRSGKGTIARVLREVVGRESVAGPTLSSLSSNFGLEPLIGKPLAIISDARLGGRSDQAAIAERLLSISGEDGLTIDRKFRQAWTGYLSTRFMMLTNELPRLLDNSGALANRFIVLVLERSFYGREDPALTNRLLGELPGILNWAMEGYRRLRARGHFYAAFDPNAPIATGEAAGWCILQGGALPASFLTLGLVYVLSWIRFRSFSRRFGPAIKLMQKNSEKAISDARLAFEKELRDQRANGS